MCLEPRKPLGVVVCCLRLRMHSHPHLLVLCFPAQANTKLKKTGGRKKERPLAPVLETEHEAVGSNAAPAPAASSSSSTAMVVSNKGTLDDSDDDFFS